MNYELWMPSLCYNCIDPYYYRNKEQFVSIWSDYWWQWSWTFSTIGQDNNNKSQAIAQIMPESAIVLTLQITGITKVPNFSKLSNTFSAHMVIDKRLLPSLPLSTGHTNSCQRHTQCPSRKGHEVVRIQHQRWPAGLLHIPKISASLPSTFQTIQKRWRPSKIFALAFSETVRICQGSTNTYIIKFMDIMPMWTNDSFFFHYNLQKQ